MTTLHAQPYDMTARGFFFETAEEYRDKAATNTNDFGGVVEEYEIQFIDGDDLDCALAKAWRLNQANFADYLDAVDAWDEAQKLAYIIAVDECGYAHDQVADDPEAVDIDIYPVDSLRELAEQFIDDGLFGDIPESLRFYIDHDAIARDLAMEYVETRIAGTRLVYRCG